MAHEDLRALPFFKDISEDIFQVITPLLNEERFSTEQVIFDEGSTSDRFFIIKEGEVEIRKAIDRASDRFKLIAVLGRGEFFGEMAVFLEQPRSAAAVAKSDCTLISMHRAELLEMFGQSPEAAFKVMGLLTSVLMDRLQNTTKELVTVYETGRRVTSAWSMQDLSDGVLDSVLGALDSAHAGIFVLWNEYNQEYEVFGQRGIEGLAAPYALNPDDPIVAFLAETREPFVSFDLASDSRLGSVEGGVYASGRSLVAAPFFLYDQLLGFMVFLNKEQLDAFSYGHMVLLSAISGYVSVAVENMRFMQAELDRARLDQNKSTIRPF